MAKLTEEPIIVVDADGVLLTAVGVGSEENVTFHCSDRLLIDEARNAAKRKLSVEFIRGAIPIKAGWETEEGILAALLLSAPGRTYVKQAPEGLLKALYEIAGDTNSSVIY